MTDRELLEQILQKVTKIDEIDKSLSLIHQKLDGITQQVVQNSEQLTIIKKQTAVNTELQQPLNAVITKVDELETDLKLIKKVVSS